MAEEQKKKEMPNQCPFCGSAGQVTGEIVPVSVLQINGPRYRHNVWVQCSTCGGRGPIISFATRDKQASNTEAAQNFTKAIESWSSRADRVELEDIYSQIQGAGGVLKAGFQEDLDNYIYLAVQTGTGKLAIGRGLSLRDCLLQVMSTVMSEAMMDRNEDEVVQ